MSGDPACAELHKRWISDESLLVNSKGFVANAFVYIDRGLENKTFAIPQQPVVIDQRGCWFRPRVLGIQTGQMVRVTNSDPVTHNIHPVAVTNREWNHSQGPRDAPLIRKFSHREIMIPVKCNIHGWMQAYFGVVEHPYFVVTDGDGSFNLGNLPSGTYTISVWHERLGRQSQQITVSPRHTTEIAFLLKAN